MYKTTLFALITEKKGTPTTIDDYLVKVQRGTWKQEVLEVRSATTKEEKRDLKARLPAISANCYYSEEAVSKSDKYTANGLMAIDLDDVDDVEGLQTTLMADPYVYAVFKSCGGKGLCVLVKIEPTRWIDAFNAIAFYFFEKYQQPVDQACKNVNRLRYVSYDPQLHVNARSELFIKYLKAVKQPAQPKRAFVNHDSIHEGFLSRLVSCGAIIADNYHDWLRVGFAIADKFGESGRSWFHDVSQANCTNGKSSVSSIIDKQYTACLRAGKTGVTFGTLVHMGMSNNVPLYDQNQKDIITAAVYGKRNRSTAESVIKQLVKVNNVPVEQAEGIVNEVYSTNEKYLDALNDQDNEIVAIVNHIKHSFTVEYNTLSGQLEVDGQDLDDRNFNNIVLDVKQFLDKKTAKDTVDMVLHSDFFPGFCPVKRWFEQNQDVHRTPDTLNSLIDCLEIIPEQAGISAYIKKWFVSGVRMWLGVEQSPLCLLLQSPQLGIGKSYFFRNLLPEDLQRYFIEQPFVLENKDEYVKICENLLMLDDEFEGRTKKDERHFKRIVDIKNYSMRRPYGRFTNKLKRNALFCATANSPDAISDTYGNRRIIPVALRSINWEKYNAVDKTAFWMSVYDLAHNKDYKHIVVGEDIEKLKKMSSMFVAADPVEELLLSYFRPKADGAYQHYREMTNTEILNMLQINSTFRALSGKRLAEYLRVYKFDSLRERNSNLKKYIVYQKELPYGGSEISEETHFKPF